MTAERLASQCSALNPEEERTLERNARFRARRRGEKIPSKELGIAFFLDKMSFDLT